MLPQAAKFIGAGLATIGVVGAGAGIGAETGPDDAPEEAPN